jgi:hypothetical protein
MSEANKGVSRCRFLEVVGAAGIGSVIGSKIFADSTPSASSGQASSPQAEPNDPNGQKEVICS